ncbi:MAG: DNA-binding protein WhiA [Clostridia bacterium]|nr:DNA-binding protein WhiA [Clostridia bacterium]
MKHHSYSEETRENLSKIEIRKSCCRKIFQLSQALTDSDESLADWKTAEEKIRCENCLAVLLRGLFIRFGSVTDPAKAIHLEYSFHSPAIADTVYSLLEQASFTPGRIVRKGKQILYFKSAGAVSDILAFIGAQSEAFRIMNDSILKEMRNNINRQVNCDTHNIHHAVSVAGNQTEKLKKLVENATISRLSPEVRTTVLLRLENPDASIQELASLHNPPISKAGCFHRLKKAISLADESDS